MGSIIPNYTGINRTKYLSPQGGRMWYTIDSLGGAPARRACALGLVTKHPVAGLPISTNKHCNIFSFVGLLLINRQGPFSRPPKAEYLNIFVSLQPDITKGIH